MGMLRSSANNVNPDEDRSHLKTKKLESGDYFGEISFLYNCRRSATIKAKLYATLGCIDP